MSRYVVAEFLKRRKSHKSVRHVLVDAPSKAEAVKRASNMLGPRPPRHFSTERWVISLDDSGESSGMLVPLWDEETRPRIDDCEIGDECLDGWSEDDLATLLRDWLPEKLKIEFDQFRSGHTSQEPERNKTIDEMVERISIRLDAERVREIREELEASFSRGIEPILWHVFTHGSVRRTEVAAILSRAGETELTDDDIPF